MFHHGPVLWTHALCNILVTFVECFKDRATIRVRHREWNSLFLWRVIIVYHSNQGLVVVGETLKDRLNCLLLGNLRTHEGGRDHETGTCCLEHVTFIETDVLLLDWGRWLRNFFGVFRRNIGYQVQ